MANSGDTPAARMALRRPGRTREENDGRVGIHAMARQPRADQADVGKTALAATGAHEPDQVTRFGPPGEFPSLLRAAGYSLDAMHPVAFQFGPFTVHWYGILVAAGFLVGLWNAARRAPVAGIPAEAVADMGPWLIVGAVVGARALYVITYWREQFAQAPWWEVFMVHHGGLVYYGGLMGAVLAGLLFIRRRNLPVWRTADVLAPGIALGYAIGRWGCLLNGCCYGRACDLPWAVRYPPDNPLGPPTFPVHPTQVYDSLLSLALYAGLAWFFRRRRFDGQVFGLYLVGYAVSRSVVECFRGDYPPGHIHFGLTPGQWVSVWVFLGGLVILLARRRCHGESTADRAA